MQTGEFDVDGVDPAGLTGSLSRLVNMLDQLDATATSATVDPGQDIRGVGTDEERLIRAEVSAYGRLESLTIDSSLSRAGATAIADRVLLAVQAAQDDALRQTTQLFGDGSSSPTAGLTNQLGQITDEATRGFDRMISDLDAAMRRIDRAGRWPR
jgi:hypothetical protein